MRTTQHNTTKYFQTPAQTNKTTKNQSKAFLNVHTKLWASLSDVLCRGILYVPYEIEGDNK